jgi:hypothetical protein
MRAGNAGGKGERGVEGVEGVEGAGMGGTGGRESRRGAPFEAAGAPPGRHNEAQRSTHGNERARNQKKTRLRVAQCGERKAQFRT